MGYCEECGMHGLLGHLCLAHLTLEYGQDYEAPMGNCPVCNQVGPVEHSVLHAKTSAWFVTDKEKAVMVVFPGSVSVEPHVYQSTGMMRLQIAFEMCHSDKCYKYHFI
jgi:hypothetical protein